MQIYDFKERRLTLAEDLVTMDVQTVNCFELEMKLGAFCTICSLNANHVSEYTNHLLRIRHSALTGVGKVILNASLMLRDSATINIFQKCLL
jgi:hypothetical protein